jgi:hypothetical protein
MSKELIEQLAKEHGAIFTDWQNAREPEIAFYGGTTQLEAFAKAYAQTQGQSIPDGWKLVPIEPTPEMIEAGNKAAHEGGCDLWQLKREVMNAWPAMLNAAPIESGVKG